MGKTRKRSKFLKLFSCLNSKTGSVDENMRDLELEKSSPLSSPFQEMDSSSPGILRGDGGGGVGGKHAWAQAQQQQHHAAVSATSSGGTSEKQRLDVTDGCRTTRTSSSPSPGVSASSSKERNLLHGDEDVVAPGRGAAAGGASDEPPLAMQEDLPSEASNRASAHATAHVVNPPSTNHKPLSRLEQVETPESSSTISGAHAHSTVAPSGGDQTEDEAEDDGAVELPPPMEEIHTHPLPAPLATPAPPGSCQEEDVHAKLTSTLQMKSEANGLSGDLAGEIESMVKHRQAGDGAPDEASYEGDAPVVDGETDGVARDAVGVETVTVEMEDTSEMSEEESTRAKNLHKRKFVITELIETELDYVRDLGLIVDGYLPALKEAALPEGMEGKDKMVFGNIHQIYDWHSQTFQAEIERCNDEPERLGGNFIRYEKRLAHMYVKYCENKPKSEFIVAEYIEFFEDLRHTMGHRLMLPDLLIKPVQRIMKYKLLLQDILKYTERAGEDTKDLQRAVEVMSVVPKAANDMMNVGRLQGFRGKITAQGKLLLQDTLLVMEQSPKAKEQAKFRERRVFLFEQIIIISEELERKKNSLTQPGYIYKNSLLANKMSLNQAGLDSEPLTFTLTDKTPGSDLKIVIQAPSDDVKQNWVTQIRSILDMQGDFLRALQAPIAYQRDQLVKELSAPEFGQPQPQPQQKGRNSLLRKTQSQPQSQSKGKDKKSKSKKSSKSDHSDLSGAEGGGRNHPLPPPLDGHGAKHADLERKTSCPTSPTSKEGGGDKPKLENKKTAPGALGGGVAGSATSGGSPKPKRNIFEGLKNTLRPKSKSQDNSSSATGHQAAPQTSNSTSSGTHAVVGGATGSPQVYANMHSMPELNVTSEEAAEPSSGAISQTRKSSGPGSVMTSSAEAETASAETVGAVLTVLSDYSAVKEDEVSVTKGDSVQILETNINSQTVLVYRAASAESPAAEGWLPLGVVSELVGLPTAQQGGTEKQGAGDTNTGGRRSWHVRFRKPSFTKSKSRDSLGTGRSGSRDSLASGSGKGGSLDRVALKQPNYAIPKLAMSGDLMFELPASFPVLLGDVTVARGDHALFTCKVCGRPRPTVTWRAPGGAVITPGPTVTMAYSDDGTVMLQLLNTLVEQSGEYICTASNESGVATSTAILTVVDSVDTPGRVVVRDQVGGCLHLEWEAPLVDAETSVLYTLQVRQQGSDDWFTVANRIPSTSHVTDELRPGGVFQFRVSAEFSESESSPFSSPSELIAIPVEELAEADQGSKRWKRNFAAEYDDIAEIGRGRFSIIKLCVQHHSGEEVAVKLISRKLQEHEIVEQEYNILQGLQHHNLPMVYDLYRLPTYHGIVMELLPSGRLFDYICTKPQFDEVQAAGYMYQLLDVTQYLHNCRIVHLDIKPENLMVDLSHMTPVLKLIDFGDARHVHNQYYVHPLVGSPEFSAPELVAGNPVGLSTDIWSIGVVLYVMLSGVSPFLDESPEETCSNIGRRDFCFPEEYFAGISQEAKECINFMLVPELSERPTARECIDHVWIQKGIMPHSVPLHVKSMATTRLADFIERRSHQNDTATMTPLQSF